MYFCLTLSSLSPLSLSLPLPTSIFTNSMVRPPDSCHARSLVSGDCAGIVVGRRGGEKGRDQIMAGVKSCGG